MKKGIYVYHDQVINLIYSSQNDFDKIEEKEPEPPIEMFYSPALPSNTVKFGQHSNGTDILFVTEDESASDIVYHTSHFENVAFPKMVFGYVVRGEKLVRGYAAVYKDQFLRDNTQLYRFPYSNVHANGALCYFSMEEIKDLVQLQTFAYRWRQVPNNDHLADSTTNLDLSLRELFEMNQNMDFNYDILLPMERYESNEPVTFDNWSQQIILSR